MRSKSESAVCNEILSYPLETLRDLFLVEEAPQFYRFGERANPEHYVTVQKFRDGDFFVGVGANFGWSKTTGSNHLPAWLDVGKRLLDAFGLTVDWS